MSCAALKHRNGQSLGSLLVLLSVFGGSAAAQVAPNIDSGYSITTFELPGGSSFAVADTAVWFLTKNELVKLDREGDRSTSVRIEDINASTWTFGAGSAWILGKSKKFSGLHRIDPQTGKLMDTIAFDQEKHQSVSYAYGSLWIWSISALAKGKPLFRIDPETKHVTRVDLAEPFNGQVAFNEGKVWLLGVEDGVLRCLDPQSNKIVDTFSVGREHDNGMLKQGFKGGSYSYGLAEGMLWVLDTQGMYGQKRVLSSYDLQTHERIAKLEVDNAVFGPVIWNGSVWLSTRGDPHIGHYIAKIDPQLKHTVGRISIAVSAEGGRESDFLPPLLVADGDSLWALSSNWWSKRTPVIVRRIQAKRREEADNQR